MPRIIALLLLRRANRNRDGAYTDSERNCSKHLKVLLGLSRRIDSYETLQFRWPATRIVLLADNSRTAYFAQAGSRQRYNGTPFAWGPVQGQIRRLGLQCQFPRVFKRGPTDKCLIPMPPPHLVGGVHGRNLHHVVVASIVSDTSEAFHCRIIPGCFAEDHPLGRLNRTLK